MRSLAGSARTTATPLWVRHPVHWGPSPRPPPLPPTPSPVLLYNYYYAITAHSQSTRARLATGERAGRGWLVRILGAFWRAGRCRGGGGRSPPGELRTCPAGPSGRLVSAWWRLAVYSPRVPSQQVLPQAALERQGLGGRPMWMAEQDRSGGGRCPLHPSSTAGWLGMHLRVRVRVVPVCLQLGVVHVRLCVFVCLCVYVRARGKPRPAVAGADAGAGRWARASGRRASRPAQANQPQALPP